MATNFVNTRRWSQISSGIQDTRTTGLNSFENSYRTNPTSSAAPLVGTLDGLNRPDKINPELSRNINNRYRWEDEYRHAKETEQYNYGELEDSRYTLRLDPPWSVPVDPGRAFVSPPRFEGLPSNNPSESDSVILNNFRPDLFQLSPYTSRSVTTELKQFDRLKEPVTNGTINLRNWTQDGVTNENLPSHSVYPFESDKGNDNTISAGLQAVNNISKLASRIKAVGEILDSYDKVGPQRKIETGYFPEGNSINQIPTYVSDSKAYDGYERQSLRTERLSNAWTSHLDRNASQSAIESHRNTRASAFISKNDGAKSKSVFDLRASSEKEHSDLQPYSTIPRSMKLGSGDLDHDPRKNGPNSSSDDLRTFRSHYHETKDSKANDKNSIPAFNPIKDYKRSWISESNLVTPTELDCLQDRIDAISTKFNYVPRAYRYILRSNDTASQDKSLPDGEYVEDMAENENDQLKSVNVWFPRKLRAKLKPQCNASSLFETKPPASSAKHVSWGDEDKHDLNSRHDNLEKKFQSHALNSNTESPLVRRSVSTDYSTTRPPFKTSTDYSFPCEPSNANGQPDSSKSTYSTPADSTRNLSTQLVQNAGVPVNKLSTQNLNFTSPERSLTIGTTNITSTSVQSVLGSAVSESYVRGLNNPSPVITSASSYSTTSSSVNLANNFNKINTLVSSGSLMAERNTSSEYLRDGFRATVKLNKDTNLLAKSQSDLRELGNKSVSGVLAYIPLKSNIDSLRKQQDDFRSKLVSNSQTVGQAQHATSVNLEDYHSRISNNVTRDPVQFSNVSVPAPTLSNQKPVLNQSSLSVSSSGSSTLTSNTVYTITYASRPVTEGGEGKKTYSNQFVTAETSNERFNYLEKSPYSLSYDKTGLDILQKSRSTVTFNTPHVTVHNEINAFETSKYSNSINAPTSDTATVASSSQMFNSPSTAWPNYSSVPTNSTLTTTSLNTPSTWIVPMSKVTPITSVQPYDGYRKNSLSTFNSTKAPTGQICPASSASPSASVTFSHGSSTIIAKHSPNLTPAFNASPSSTITPNSTYTPSNAQTFISSSASSGVPTFNDIYKDKTYSATSASSVSACSSTYTMSWNTPMSTTATASTTKLPSSFPMFNDVRAPTLSITFASSLPKTVSGGAYTLSSNALTTTPTTMCNSSQSLDSMSINQNLLSSIEALRKLSNSLSSRRTLDSVARNIPYIDQHSATAVTGSNDSELGRFKGTITSATDGFDRNNSITNNNNDLFEHSNDIKSKLLTNSSRRNFEKTGNDGVNNDITSLYSCSSSQYDSVAQPSSKSSQSYHSPAGSIGYSSNNKSYVSPAAYQMHQYSTAQSSGSLACTASSITHASNVTDSISTPANSGIPQSNAMSSPMVSYKNNYLDSNGDDSTVHGSFTNIPKLGLHANDTSITPLLHSKSNLTYAGLNTSVGTSLSSNIRLHDTSTNALDFWHKNASTPDLTLLSERATNHHPSEIPVEIFSSTKSSAAHHPIAINDWLPKFAYTSEYDSCDSSYRDADCFHLPLPPVSYNRHRSISSTDSEDRCLSIGDLNSPLADDWSTAMNFNSASPASRNGARVIGADDGASRSSDTEFVVMRSGEIVKRKCGRDNGSDVIQTI